jgi:hypothetical protein
MEETKMRKRKKTAIKKVTTKRKKRTKTIIKKVTTTNNLMSKYRQGGEESQFSNSLRTFDSKDRIAMRLISVPILICLLFTMAIEAAGSEDDISLYSSSAEPTAYIEESTIYLWSGKPVAYLNEDDDEGSHVYGFNGKHLGWFVDGVLRDHEGKAVGAVREVFTTPTDAEPFKGFKQFRPFADFMETAPPRPVFINKWSDMPFKLFLMQGVSD